MIRIDPKTLHVKTCLTLLSPASHHDPNLGGEANQRLYNRQLVRIPYEPKTCVPLTAEDRHRVAVAFPIPKECEPIFTDEPFSQFIGIALIKIFINRYGRVSEDGDWGTGIFTGVEAYRRLQERIEMAAPRSVNLKEFWSILLKDMQCGAVANSDKLFTLLAIPTHIHHETLFHLQKHAALVVEMARHWIHQTRLANADYAKSKKEPQASGEMQTLVFEAITSVEVEEMSVAIPCHSGNDIRHRLRYASMMHLFATLGLGPDTELPNGVKALLENGGNIAKGISAPATAYALTQTIRATYPSLGLLGGCVDGFILGDANLESVTPWWFGRENNEALLHVFGVKAEHSVIEMLDSWTLHRHSSSRHTVSPMPYNFETLSAGAKLFVSFQLSPWISDQGDASYLQYGAFWAALKTYENIDATIGGQIAKGFGNVKIDILDGDTDALIEASHEYEAYLEKNKDALVLGLKKGHSARTRWFANDARDAGKTLSPPCTETPIPQKSGEGTRAYHCVLEITDAPYQNLRL